MFIKETQNLQPIQILTTEEAAERMVEQYPLKGPEDSDASWQAKINNLAQKIQELQEKNKLNVDADKIWALNDDGKAVVAEEEQREAEVSLVGQLPDLTIQEDYEDDEDTWHCDSYDEFIDAIKFYGSTCSAVKVVEEALNGGVIVLEFTFTDGEKTLVSVGVEEFYHDAPKDLFTDPGTVFDFLTEVALDARRDWQAPITIFNSVGDLVYEIINQIEQGNMQSVSAQDDPKRLTLGWVLKYKDGSAKWYQLRIKDIKRTKYELPNKVEIRTLHYFFNDLIAAREKAKDFTAYEVRPCFNYDHFISELCYFAAESDDVDIHQISYPGPGVGVHFRQSDVLVLIEWEDFYKDNPVPNPEDLTGDMEALAETLYEFIKAAHANVLPAEQEEQEEKKEGSTLTAALACLAISSFIGMMKNKKAASTLGLTVKPATVAAEVPAEVNR